MSAPDHGPTDPTSTLLRDLVDKVLDLPGLTHTDPDLVSVVALWQPDLHISAFAYQVANLDAGTTQDRDVLDDPGALDYLGSVGLADCRRLEAATQDIRTSLRVLRDHLDGPAGALPGTHKSLPPVTGLVVHLHPEGAALGILDDDVITPWTQAAAADKTGFRLAAHTLGHHRELLTGVEEHDVVARGTMAPVGQDTPRNAPGSDADPTTAAPSAALGDDRDVQLEAEMAALAETKVDLVTERVQALTADLVSAGDATPDTHGLAVVAEVVDGHVARTKVALYTPTGIHTVDGAAHRARIDAVVSGTALVDTRVSEGGPAVLLVRVGSAGSIEVEVCLGEASFTWLAALARPALDPLDLEQLRPARDVPTPTTLWEVAPQGHYRPAPDVVRELLGAAAHDAADRVNDPVALSLVAIREGASLTYCAFGYDAEGTPARWVPAHVSPVTLQRLFTTHPDLNVLMLTSFAPDEVGEAHTYVTASHSRLWRNALVAGPDTLAAPARPMSRRQQSARTLVADHLRAHGADPDTYTGAWLATDLPFRPGGPAPVGGPRDGADPAPWLPATTGPIAVFLTAWSSALVGMRDGWLVTPDGRVVEVRDGEDPQLLIALLT